MLGWVCEIRNEKGKRVAHYIADTLEENLDFINARLINNEELREIVKGKIPVKFLVKWSK